MKGFVLSVRMMGYAHHRKTQKIILQVCDQYAKSFCDKNVRLFNSGLMSGMNLRLHCKDLSNVQWKLNDLNDIIFKVLEKNLKGEVEFNKIEMPDIRINLTKNYIFVED